MHGQAPADSFLNRFGSLTGLARWASHNPQSSGPLRRTASALTAFTVILVFTGCAEPDGPVGPPTDKSARQEATSAGTGLPVIIPFAPTGSSSPAPTLRDEYTAMASRVPGGFGGFYYDDDGTLTVLLVDPSKQAEARAALAREQFVQNRTEAVGRTEFDVQSAETAKAQYPHDQLHAWLDELLHRLRSFAVTPTKSGISVRRNRIVVGVRSKNDRTKARTALDQAGFPEDAVIVELAPPLRLAKTVHDRFRPVPGGVQIVYHNDKGISGFVRS